MQASKELPSASLNATAPGTAIPLYTRMALAAISGMGAATICHPLDVIRVNMQTATATSTGAGAGTVVYKNTLDAGVQIFRQSGLQQGLYAGISAAYLRQWLYGSCRIGIYSYLLEQAQIDNRTAGRDANDISFQSKLLMGMCSGSIGSFVGTPSELALVRMSADAKADPLDKRNYKHVGDCIARIAREEGFTNLWRGAAPTVLRATLLSSCQLGVTSEAKQVLAESGYFTNSQTGEEIGGGLPKMFCAVLFSSFVANIVANPFDVLKSRLQNMPIRSDGTAMYKSMSDCFLQSVKAEGLMVLYKGFTPAFVKLAPYSIISLTLADKLTKALTGKDAL